MEFLASLTIKALIGTSVCGAVTVGTIYKCDKTLLGFKDNSQIETGSPDNDNSAKSVEGQEKGEKETGGASDGVLSSNLEDSVSDSDGVIEDGGDDSKGGAESSNTDSEETISPDVKPDKLALVSDQSSDDKVTNVLETEMEGATSPTAPESPREPSAGLANDDVPERETLSTTDGTTKPHT